MANPTIVVSAGGNAIQWSAGGSFNVTEKCYTCQGSMPEGSSFCPTCGSRVAGLGGRRSSKAPHAGEVVGEAYRLVRIVSQGGMGTVYEAEHVRLRQKVAVKLLHPDLCGTDRFERRFYAEAIAASHLSHPNIVTAHDFGPHGDQLYLAMEYLDGRTLRDVICDDFPIPAQRIGRILSQVASALEVAHDQGVIHRDLKPENIILMRVGKDEDYVKVVDFGIAKLTEPIVEGLATYQTVPGVFVGTPEYSAPELVGSNTPGPSSDVYSRGSSSTS